MPIHLWCTLLGFGSERTPLKQQSLRTTFSIVIGIIVVAALAGVSYLSLYMTRQAYLDLALRDIDFMAEQLASELDPIAARSSSAEDFARQAEQHLRHISEGYFAKNNMSGYANVWATDGTNIYHPKIAPGVNVVQELGAQAVDVMQKAEATGFNGTIFYTWQNAGESQPRDKFAALHSLPSHPDWFLFVTAYTTDDLLLEFRTVQWWLIGAGAVAMVVTLLYVFWNTSRMVKAVHAVERQLVRIAEGDLGSVDADLAGVAQRRDELGNMARTLRTTVEGLRRLIAEVQAASAHMASTAEALSHGSDESAASMQQVARAIEAVAASADELSRGAGGAETTTTELKAALAQVAQGAQDQSRHVQSTVDVINQLAGDMEELVLAVRQIQNTTEANGASAREGRSLAVTTTTGMEQIRGSVAAATARLTRLSEASGQIGSITQAITEIADQTNLLALNAAIEAARAGEHGRGFAVVADEVRRLAERSATSAREIRDLVAGIQNGIAALSEAMAQSTRQVTDGADLVLRSGQAFADVVQAVEEAVAALQSVSGRVASSSAATFTSLDSISSVAAIIEENTAAAEEMTASAEQVQEVIRHAAIVASDNAAATEEVSASVEEVATVVEQVAESARTLRSVSGELKAVVSRFKL
jgi:methyl-accepting chemotaxis protein